MDIAELLGSPECVTMRLRIQKRLSAAGEKLQRCTASLIAGCRAVTEYAAEKGIKTMVENHGFFCQDSERVEKLICGVNHVNFGVLVDIGNFLCVDENPCDAIGRLMPYAFHVHAKDFHVKSGLEPNPGTGWFTSRGGNFLRGAIIGHGNVPLSNASVS